MSNVHVIETDKTDKEKAEEYKKEAIELHKPILELLNKAKKENFIINVSCSDTPTGFQITQLMVLKSF